MPNPACEVKNGGAAYVGTSGGVDVTPAATVIIRLIDTSADSWSIECVYTDDTSVAATVTSSLTIDTTLRTATFTAPVAGKTYIFRSRVNNGVGADGKIKSSYSTTFGVYTLTAGGDRVIAANETTEGGAFGWVEPINNIIRSGPGGGDTLPDPTGHAGDALAVKSDETGYELVDVVDMPALAGNSLKYLRANTGETALEFATAGVDNGRIPITFADANIDLTGAPHNKTRNTIAGAILSLSGSNATTVRDLTIPRPADDSEAYVIELEMGVGTNGVRLIHAGGNWTFPAATGNATHHVMVRNGAVTALGPAGTAAQLGVQYVNASGYFAAVPIGSALQVLRVNAGGNGYEFAAAAGGGSVAGSDTQVQFNDGGSFGADSGFTWDKTSNVLTVTGAYAVGSGTKHASALIRLAYAATDVVIGAPNNGGTDYPVLHRTSANSWRFGDATGWNTSVYGDVVTFYGASGTTMYAPGGSVVAIEFAASANIGLFDGAGFGSGSKVLSVANATTAPTTNPTGGAIWYVEGGASKARGSGGTVTTFGPAEPHCPTCGRDFATEHRNDEMGEHLAVCLPCLIDTLKDAGIDTKKFAMVDKRGAGKAAWDENHAKAKVRTAAAEADRQALETSRRMALAREAALRAVVRDARKDDES